MISSKVTIYTFLSTPRNIFDRIIHILSLPWCLRVICRSACMLISHLRCIKFRREGGLLGTKLITLRGMSQELNRSVSLRGAGWLLRRRRGVIPPVPPPSSFFLFYCTHVFHSHTFYLLSHLPSKKSPSSSLFPFLFS